MITAKALVIEDAPEYAALGKRILESAGYEVTVAVDGIEGVGVADSLHPDLVLLDVGLPAMDGFDVCRRIRAFSNAYVIMLTARGDEFDRVLGLAVGADDYVIKPFSARELAMRIKAMQRRPREPAIAGVRQFADLVVDTQAREVRLHGTLVDLTRIEFDLLNTLVTRPGRALSRRLLMEAVWGGEWFGDDHVVDVHMANLRRKLGDPVSTPKNIRTVRGIGYRFDP